MAKESIKFYTDLQNSLLKQVEDLPSSLKDSDSWIVKQIKYYEDMVSEAQKKLDDLEGA